MAIHGLTGIPLEPALTAYQRTSASLSASEFRLSSGHRIRRIGEDTASVTTATALQSDISTLRSSLENGAHATTLLQIADNSLSQISTILDSLADLTATANGPGLTPLGYSLLDGQFQQQKAAIDSIVSRSTYQGANLLDGTFTGAGVANYQLGSVASATVPIAIPSVTSASLFPAPTSLGNAGNATLATTHVGNAQGIVNDAIAKVGAYQVRIDAAEAATRSDLRGAKDATDNLLNTDITEEAAKRSSAALKQHTAAALFTQALGINANLLSLIH